MSGDDETVLCNTSVEFDVLFVVATPFKFEWTDDDAFISSSFRIFDGIIERFNAWVVGADEWNRFADGNWLGEEDFRDSEKIGDDDDVLCSGDWVTGLESDDDDDDDCFDIVFWRICSRFLPAAVVLYLKNKKNQLKIINEKNFEFYQIWWTFVARGIRKKADWGVLHCGGRCVA